MKATPVKTRKKQIQVKGGQQRSDHLPTTDIIRLLRDIKKYKPHQHYGQILWNAFAFSGYWRAPYASLLYYLSDGKMQSALEYYRRNITPRKYCRQFLQDSQVESGIPNYEDAVMCYATAQTRGLYFKLRKAIFSLGTIKVSPRRNYIEFLNDLHRNSPFASVTARDDGLEVYLYFPKIAKLKDPKGVAKHVSSAGHWGQENYAMRLNSTRDLPYAIGLIKQAFEYS